MTFSNNMTIMNGDRDMMKVIMNNFIINSAWIAPTVITKISTIVITLNGKNNKHFVRLFKQIQLLLIITFIIILI